jgi:2,4-dienoyl-CoA reductase (NADPH2)
MTLRFVHVLNGPSGEAVHRWQELTRLVGFDPPPDLKLIRSAGDISLDLIELINRDKYGTIIMGKRGFSRIKRWLLGSVSAGVLKRLTDQSLILID